jgi:hypothetical protein
MVRTVTSDEIVLKYYRFCKNNGYIFQQPSVVDIARNTHIYIILTVCLQSMTLKSTSLFNFKERGVLRLPS